MTPLADNALTALERARQAQERHERRIDVQLRLGFRCAKCREPFSQGFSGCVVNGTEYSHFPTCPVTP